MEAQSALIKQQSEWNNKDKSQLLLIQKIVACVGIFFSIVQCTNLFLLIRQSNRICLSFAIASLAVTLLHLLSLFWAQKTQSAFSQDYDDHDEKPSASGALTQIILFTSVALVIYFAKCYIVFDFAPSNLINAQLAIDARDIGNYKDALLSKGPWIDFLSFGTIILLLYTVFCSFTISSSVNAQRVMVYLFTIGLAIVSFGLLCSIQFLYKFLQYAIFTPTSWALTTLYWVGIVGIIFLVFLFFLNAKRIQSGYLIVGSIFLLGAIVAAPSVGQVFRDWKSAQKLYSTYCPQELGKLSKTFVESKGCPQKYQKTTNALTSLNAITHNNIYSCTKEWRNYVWEKDLATGNNQNFILACLNKDCCGIVQNIYTDPILKIGACGVLFIFLSFTLTAFSYSLSSDQKLEDQLSKGLQIFLTLVFVLIILIGLFWVFLPSAQEAFRRPEVIVRDQQTITNHQVSKDTYYAQQGCFQIDKLTKDGNKYYQTFHQKGAATTFLEPGSFTVTGDNDRCHGCANKGYILGIQITGVKETDINKGGVYFRYTVDPDAKYKIISGDRVAELIFTETPSVFALPTERNFGIIGDSNQIQSFVKNNLYVCGVKVNNVNADTGAVSDPTSTVIAPGAAVVFQYNLQSIDLKNIKIAKTGSLDVSELPTTGSEVRLKKHYKKQTSNRKLVADKYLEKQVNIVVRDVVTGLPIPDAQVDVYFFANFKLTSSTLTDAHKAALICAPQSKAEAEYTGVTDANGVLVFTSILKVDVALTGKKQIAEQFKYSYTAYASKDGYSYNCRTFAHHVELTHIDVGLSPQLSSDQVRVVLEWGSFIDFSGADDAYADSLKKPFDLDLYATFSDENTQEYVCAVGVLDTGCGALHYHGNENGTYSTEAITVDRFTQNKFLFFASYEPTVAPVEALTVENFPDYWKARPFWKFFAPEQSGPSHVIVPADQSPAFSAPTPTKSHIFAHSGYCIDGAITEVVQVLHGANKDYMLWTDVNTKYTDDIKKSYYPTAPAVCGKKEAGKQVWKYTQVPSSWTAIPADYQ